MSSVDLSIVIVSYNVRDLLAQCLASVLKSSGDGAIGQSPVVNRISLEVFVVDNASSDGSAAMVRERFPAVCVIENGENRGFAAANNQAFEQTRGRYVLMLNPDTEVRAGALQMLVEFMDAHPRAGACGGRLLYGDTSFQHSAFGFPSLAQVFLDFFPINWRLMHSRLNGRYPKAWYERGQPFPVDHPLGADLLVRRASADQVGWLDPQFFIYCEEIDWCIRLKRAGWQVFCVPRAEIVHYEAKSTVQFRDKMYVELWRARSRLFQKHYSGWFRLAVRAIVGAGLAYQARSARAAAQQGAVTQEALEQRLAAFHQIHELFR